MMGYVNMKQVILFLIFALLSRAMADESADPVTVYLPDGQVLEKSVITKYRSYDVVIKHTRGVTVLRYEFLPDELRSEAEKHRPGGSKQIAGKAAKNKKTVSGQVFLAVRGAGSIKFADVMVYALPIEAESVWQAKGATVVQLPRPIAKAKTSADGQFSMTVPSGQPFILYAQGKRVYGDGKEEPLEWRRRSSTIDDWEKADLYGSYAVPRVAAAVDDWD